MHELSVVQNIIQIIENKFHEENVTISEVIMEIGELTCVEHKTLTFCFDSIKESTFLKDTKFSIITVKGKGECSYCGNKQLIPTLYSVCENCEKTGMKIIQGKELQLQSVEIKKNV